MRIALMSIFCALLITSPVIADDNCDNQFCTLDKNQDNHVSKKEFVDGQVTVDRQKAVKLFPDMRDVEHLNDSTLTESLFDRMDKNRDGLLSKDEWGQAAPNILEIRF